jgi:putative DNA methylase
MIEVGAVSCTMVSTMGRARKTTSVVSDLARPRSAKSSQRFVEVSFPFVEISRLVAADLRLKDPVYGLHRWFARRPPSLVRSLLLGAYLPASTPSTEFWQRMSSPGAWLDGATVYDPFMGGGTSLVEAARMGAAVAGRDVDPLAVLVVGAELSPAASSDAAAVCERLLGYLGEHLADLFVAPDALPTPLHWFWLRRVRCPDCGANGLLYRDLILAAHSGRIGAVVRHNGLYAFCPDCLSVHALSAGRKILNCCGRRWSLANGTYAGSRYRCSCCGSKSSHERLRTGSAERVLVAVEETLPASYRRIRAATEFDRNLVSQAKKRIDSMDIKLPTLSLALERRDRRPVSLGFSSASDLFSERQRLLFGTAFAWLSTQGELTDEVRRAVTLMLTGCLTSNNLLCGYAREYGRLAPLFSVRGYALPALSVELNALHPVAGRGTLRAGVRRLTRASMDRVQRHTLTDDQLVREDLNLPVRPTSVEIICASADDPSPHPELKANVCVTDPPYFDYIAYSELSEFYRCWLDHPSLGGRPLLPDRDDPVGSFASSLARCLKITYSRLDAEVPIVFTYHSPHIEAWRAIGEALDQADLKITAVWPVLADPHMGHHAHSGNCEWDIIIVCRPVRDTIESPLSVTAESWQAELRQVGLTVKEADLACFRLALSMAGGRFGQVI